MRELKVRLAEDTYSRLKEIAALQLRSMTKQVTKYVMEGLKNDGSVGTTDRPSD